VSTTNVNGVSPLWIACQDGHLPVVKYCAALAPKLLEQPKASGATPFCIACHQGHLDLVEFLADQHVDMERPNHNGASPMFYAASNGHIAVVKLLLSRGVSANTADADGTSPFHVACRQGHVCVAEALADCGADIDTTAADGQSALEVAVAHERRSVVAWLSHVQSVPSTTPKLVAALQRQAWAAISLSSPLGLLLSYDLLEVIGNTVPARVSWQFAMQIVNQLPDGQSDRAPGDAHTATEQVIPLPTMLPVPPPRPLTPPALPPRIRGRPSARGGGGGDGGRAPTGDIGMSGETDHENESERIEQLSTA
jgi:hypothetical protein